MGLWRTCPRTMTGLAARLRTVKKRIACSRWAQRPLCRPATNPSLNCMCTLTSGLQGADGLAKLLAACTEAVSSWWSAEGTAYKERHDNNAAGEEQHCLQQAGLHVELMGVVTRLEQAAAQASDRWRWLHTDLLLQAALRMVLQPASPHTLTLPV